MKHLVKKSRFFPDIPSIVSGFFDDDRWWNFPELTDWKTRIPAANVKETNKEFYRQIKQNEVMCGKFLRSKPGIFYENTSNRTQ